MNTTEEKAKQFKEFTFECLVSSGEFGVNGARTGSESDAPLTPSGSGFDLPTVRRLLGTREGPLVAVLRRQLSNYARGDAESKAALRPLILASVGLFDRNTK